MRNAALVLATVALQFFPVTAIARPLTIDKTTIDALVGEKSLRSSEGKPIAVHTLDLGSPKITADHTRHFLIQGGLHGNEAMTSEFVLWLAKRAHEGRSLLNQLPPSTVIDFVPYANPDSYGKSRYNAHAVNLNRNFGVLWGLSREPNGEKAFSEPETTAIRKLMERRRYLGAVDVHGYINWVVAPSRPEQVAQASHRAVERYAAWTGALAQAINKIAGFSGYELKRAGTLGDGGAFEDWSFWSNDTFAFCLEMQSVNRFILGKKPSEPMTDTYMAYEKLIYQMFDQAITIDRATPMKTKPIVALKNGA